jgi:hypothetical protein
MKKTEKTAPLDWKDALGSIKTSFVKEGEAKKARQKEHENALRPYFNKAAIFLGINEQQLAAEIKVLEPGLKEILTDRRLKASTYAKLIKKHNSAYYHLFEDKIKSAVKAEQKYFLEKKEAALKSVKIMQTEAAPTERIQQKLTKYEKRAKKRLRQNKQGAKAKFTNAPIRSLPVEVSQWISVEWHDLVFEDYLIKVKYGTNYSQGYPVAESRKSFKYLRKYIKNLQLPMLSVLLVGNEIREIKNVERVKEMVTLLRIKEQLIEDFQNGKTITAVSMLEKIGPVSKQFLTQMAMAGNGELMCIEYLASQLADNFKPIPAFELIPSGNSISTEDTFIFVVERQAKLFLVWESTVHGRATYIFKANIDNYVDVVQAIYDYIGSPRKAKRMSLRKRDAETSNLCYDGYVTHSAFDHWQQKLETVFNSQ